MSPLSAKERLVLQAFLILVVLGFACLLHAMQGYNVVVLDLFFLPVILGAFFLGRYQGGMLAVLCVIFAATVAALGLSSFSTAPSPLMIGLAVAVWAAVLALAALLVGTLSDDRQKRMKELQEAHVGVAEVLSRYLQSAHPGLRAQSIRGAELCRKVAIAMKLSPREIDDVRVAALLYDLGNVEITTRVIRRAVGAFEEVDANGRKHTFQGTDLMLSLGSVLRGAIPLLLGRDPNASATPTRLPAEIPVGAKIIRAVRAYRAQVPPTPDGREAPAAAAFRELREDTTAAHDPQVLGLLEQIVAGEARLETPVPAPAIAVP
ncbi:MAG: HD domain-containing phosphohydrolase [Planctomycetota bacterium]|jgi:hypothetical protein